LLLALALLGTALRAQSPTEAQAKEKISRAAAAVKSMECDFVQTKTLRMLNDKLVSKGRMHYRQPDQLRWEYTSPYRYAFVLNGDRVLLKKDDRNDVIDVRQNKVFREIARIMMNSITGKGLTDERDFKSSVAQTPAEWVATLTPVRKDMRQLFSKLVVCFDRQAAMVKKVTLVEANGDQTVIELKNIKTNGTVSASLFDIR